MKLKGLGTALFKWAKKNTPAICTALGVGTLIGATGLAVHATVKAVKTVDAAEEKKGEPLTKKEVVKEVAPIYIPTVAAVVAGAGLVIAGHKLNVERQAVLAATLTAAETTIKDYQKVIPEVVGEKKAEEIRTAVAEEEVKRHDICRHQSPEVEEIENPGGGDTLCYEPFKKKYFWSSMNAIKRAENATNKQMLVEDYVGLNDFYYQLGLDDCKLADGMGWSMSRDGYIDLKFSSHINDEGTPVLAIDYGYNPPHRDYNMYGRL